MIVWAALIVLALSAVTGAFLARLGWPIELAASLLPQIATVFFLLGLSLFMLGRPASGACALAAVAICAFGARELFAPPTPPLATRDVRIVWANLMGERDAFVRAVRLAEREGADLMVLADFPDTLTAEDARALTRAYAHQAGAPAIDGARIAVFSRAPLAGSEAFGVAWLPERHGLALRIVTAAGPLHIIGVHPSVPFTPRAQRARDETTALALQRLRAGGPGVLVGDFNTVPWAPVVRGALADGAVARAHLGARSTWASPWPILGLPIDHTFSANGARTSARIGPGLGSDHMPLIVDVALPSTPQ
jgi:endonuclease/exonuclease/phosphatase (EEP) superfamily protein YafD